MPQLALQFNPSERTRLNRQCATILEAFKAAPLHRLTNFQLVTICIRYSARIHELRKAGYTIEIISRDHKTGLSAYELHP
jgi:hypothetical protein